jgi:uncharacterized protein YcaQ
MSTKPETLSRRDAVRIALAAQGVAGARRVGNRTGMHLVQVLSRTHLLQIDSVNVLTRAHYMPFYSRLGAYDPGLLDAAAWGKRRGLFEYWAHEASLLPLSLHPYLRWRMARAERGQGVYGRIAELARDRPEFITAIFREIEIGGPRAAGDLDRANHKGSRWWGWTDTKIALEYLFWAGRITVATRRGFERVYDLTERVLPTAILAAPTPPEPDARRHLILLAAQALGVATESDLRDYFRLDIKDGRALIAELAEDGQLIPVTVEEWGRPAYLHPEAAIPGMVTAHALLSPFDPLVWTRERTERLFGFRYRLEIYTPAHKRQHGYYVLPFLTGETLAARVDLKADRRARVLRVAAAHLEMGSTASKVAPALIAELLLMARWLGLETIAVEPTGDLAGDLASLALQRSPIGGTRRGSGPV